MFEVSPARPLQEKPKKSLMKHFNFQAVKVGGLDDNDNDSNTSTPKAEGGIQKADKNEGDIRFDIIENE